jgi:hypothetical protein
MGAHLFRQYVIHVAVGEIALFLAHFNQALNIVVFKFIVDRQMTPTLFGIAGDTGPLLSSVQGRRSLGSRRPEYIALGKIIPGNAAAQSRLGTVLRTGAGSSPRRKKRFQNRNLFGARGHKPAVTRKKRSGLR